MAMRRTPAQKAQALITECERDLVIQGYRDFHRNLTKEVRLFNAKNKGKKVESK